MWGVNKLLTTVAVALCFFSGAVFASFWLMLLSVLIALGALLLERYPLHRAWCERRTSRRQPSHRRSYSQSLGRTKTSKPPPSGKGTISPAGSNAQPADEGQVAEIWSRFVK